MEDETDSTTEQNGNCALSAGDFNSDFEPLYIENSSEQVSF